MMEELPPNNLEVPVIQKNVMTTRVKILIALGILILFSLIGNAIYAQMNPKIVEAPITHTDHVMPAANTEDLIKDSRVKNRKSGGYPKSCKLIPSGIMLV